MPELTVGDTPESAVPTAAYACANSFQHIPGNVLDKPIFCKH
jgi:hypothetical protein